MTLRVSSCLAYPGVLIWSSTLNEGRILLSTLTAYRKAGTKSAAVVWCLCEGVMEMTGQVFSCAIGVAVPWLKPTEDSRPSGTLQGNERKPPRKSQRIFASQTRLHYCLENFRKHCHKYSTELMTESAEWQCFPGTQVIFTSSLEFWYDLHSNGYLRPEEKLFRFKWKMERKKEVCYGPRLRPLSTRTYMHTCILKTSISSG